MSENKYTILIEQIQSWIDTETNYLDDAKTIKGEYRHMGRIEAYKQVLSDIEELKSTLSVSGSINPPTEKGEMECP